MSTENVVSAAGPSQRRPLGDRLGILVPGLSRFVFSLLLRLSPRSRVRRSVMRAAIPRIFAAGNRGDAEAATVLADPDLELRLFGFAGLGMKERYEGRTGFAEALADWNATMDELQFHPEEILDLGDRLLVRVRVSARGKASGVETTTIAGFLYFVSHTGQVTRMHDYYDWDQAIAAAGLTEQTWRSRATTLRTWPPRLNHP